MMPPLNNALIFRAPAIFRRMLLAACIAAAVINCASPTFGAAIVQWVEDGNGQDYLLTYFTDMRVDIGDPWKTMAEGSTHADCNEGKMTGTIEATKQITFEVGWDELVVATLGIQTSVSVSVSREFTIPPCKETAIVEWKWVGDYVHDGVISTYSEDRKELITSTTFGNGYYNYAPKIGSMVTTPCKHGCCDVPEGSPHGSLELIGALALIGCSVCFRKQMHS